MIKVGIKNQEYCIMNYHKERTMLKVFVAIRNYIRDKKEYRSNALVFKHRGYQRKLIYAWRVVSKHSKANEQLYRLSIRRLSGTNQKMACFISYPMFGCK